MSLITHIREQMAQSGPLPLATYMEMALSHPEYGYYMRRDPLGAEGDFTTAPEISQLFGEMVGIWIVHRWQQMESPEHFVLCECGPGRGTLMADIVRVLRQYPDCLKACRVQMIETSPALKAKQMTLQETFPKVSIEWQENLDHLPPLPLIYIANEFFDALPIQQYVLRTDGWHERMVTIEDDKLAWTEDRASTSLVLPTTLPRPAIGSFYETCPAGSSVMTQVSEHLSTHGGGALIIDYGYTQHAFGDTLQAVKSHTYHPVLETPGEADLTAHVNFAMLREIAQQAKLSTHLHAQGPFLEQMGISVRLHQLCNHATPEQRHALITGVQRLIDPAQMGELFKVMEVTA